MNARLGVLISGRGSNLQSIIEAVERRTIAATVEIVLSNRADAAGLERARAAGVSAVAISPRDYTTRDAYDAALAGALLDRGVDLVCLAGFMRLVGTPLIQAFPNRMLNIHPSLLPSFPGLEAQRQALAHGVRISGATVHLVDAELDGGPIVAQEAVSVLDDDTVASLSERILAAEHRLYPEAIRRWLKADWRVEGRRFVVGGRAE